MQISLNTYAVRGDNGMVDQDGTLEKFADDLSKFCAARDLEQGQIAEQVEAVFDKLKADKTQRVNMPFVVHAVLPRLNAQSNNYQVLEERILGYIRENADGKGLDLFTIGKGRGKGGVARKADLPPPAPETETK